MSLFPFLLRNKSLSLYIENFPPSEADSVAYNTLVKQLPPTDIPAKMLLRQWSDYYSFQFVGNFVGYYTLNEEKERTEVLIPLEEFKMSEVPWGDILI